MVENEIHSINAGRYVPVFIDNLPCSALVDSGNSAGCCISSAFAHKLGLTLNELDNQKFTIGTARKGSNLTCLGKTTKPLKLTFAGTTFSYKFRPFVIDELSSNINLSLDFLEKHNIDQIHSKKCIRVHNKMIPMHGSKKAFGVNELDHNLTQNLNVYIAEETIIPAMSARVVQMRIPRLEQLLWFGGTGILEPEDAFLDKYDLLPATRAIVTVNEKGKTKTSILNDTAEDIRLPKNSKFGFFDGVVIKEDPMASKQLDWSTEKIVSTFNLDKSPILNTAGKLDKAVKLLRKFGALISDDKENYGSTSLVQHTIDTKQSKPIRQKMRNLNQQLQDNFDKQLDKWLKKDIVEESNSPWSSRLVPVAKKNGDIRWCVDYRELNNITVKDAFPLPNIEESLTKMSNCRVFSALDGTGAYHAVHIDEADREKTAFACHRGTFQFKRMPFGLCNAPATFSRLIMKALMGLDKKYYAPFLDDVAIFSNSFEDHLMHLCNVLSAQQAAGMTLQPAKCQLFRDKIDFLGHTVSKSGIETNKAFVEVIEKWPYPKTIEELRTFLGKTGYYRKFIRDYSKLAAPLLNMITKDTTKKKKMKITLSENQQKAFLKLKKKLTSAPILAFADFDSKEPFILDTDWSKDPGAIGAVLSQKQGGVERVICYGGRKSCNLF